MRSKSPKRCFIAAPASVDTEPLRRVLEKRSIEWSDAATAEPGASLMDTVTGEIARSDFVCLMLPKRSRRSNVMLELGFALGQGKPVLLLAERDATLPFDASAIPYGRIDIKDEEAIAFHIDAFREHAVAHKPPPSFRTKERGKIDTRWAKRELAKIKATAPQQRSVRFEKMVYRLLEQSGSVVVQNPNGPDAGVDMALWIDDIQSTIGNPVLVECKTGQMTSDRLTSTCEQLREYMARTHVPAAMLVTDKPIRSRGPWGLPLVFAVSIERLIELIAENRLSASLLQMRNELMHSKG